MGAKEKSTPSTTSPVATTTTTWPPLPAFDATLAWAELRRGFQCGTLTVPVDWAKPTGERVGIALIRRPAVVPDQRLGSLVFNYGGPGQSGVEYLRLVWSRIPQTVLDRFDIVSFDPHGRRSFAPGRLRGRRGARRVGRDRAGSDDAGAARPPASVQHVCTRRAPRRPTGAMRVRSGRATWRATSRRSAGPRSATHISTTSGSRTAPPSAQHKRRFPRVRGPPGARRSPRLLDQRARRAFR